MRIRLSVLLVATLAVVACSAVSAGAVTPQITSNEKQTCVLIDNGDVWCAGSNVRHQLQEDDTALVRPFFARLPAVVDATQITSGDQHLCVLVSGGQVGCWGDNRDYRLGRGEDNQDPSKLMQLVIRADHSALSGITQIASADWHTCARAVDGTAWCWGDNQYGQIGDATSGAAADRGFATQVKNADGSGPLSGVIKVMAAGRNSCAIVTGGEVWCWGSAEKGALGDGSGLDSALPVRVSGITGALDIGVGYQYACALLADQSVRCWGSNEDGQQGSGLGHLEHNATPVTVPGLSGVTTLALGWGTVCVVTADTHMHCWGAGVAPLWGGTQSDDIRSPQVVPDADGALMLSPGFEGTFCALFAAGDLKCAGLNSVGQAGVDSGGLPLTAATAIPGVNLLTGAWTPPSGGPGAGGPGAAGPPYAAASAKLKKLGKPKFDKKAKNVTLTTALTLVPDARVALAQACSGKVTASAVRTYYVKKTVKLKKNGKVKRVKKRVKKTKTYKKTGALKLSGSSCTTKIALKLPVKFFARKKVKVTQTTTANAALLKTSASTTLKVPKAPKPKKKKKR